MEETGMLFSLVLSCQLVLELDFSEGELHHCWSWQKCTQNPCKGIRKVCRLQTGESTPSSASLFLVLSVSCWYRKPLLYTRDYDPQFVCQRWESKQSFLGAACQQTGEAYTSMHTVGQSLSKILFKTRCPKDDALYLYSVAVLFYFNGNVYNTLLLTTFWINKESY